MKFTTVSVAVAALMGIASCAPRGVLPAISTDSRPQLWGTLQPGKVPAVGFARVAGNPQVDVWYPSHAGKRRLSLSEYAGDRVKDYEAPFLAQGVSRERLTALMSSPLYAWMDADPGDGTFPLVLLAHGNAQNTVDLAIIAEYIASHGYVVASVPSPMVTRPMRAMSELAGFAEEQADALSRADSVTRSRFRIRGRTAIVAHSFGARAALLLAMRTGAISTIVSLDGGIGTRDGREEFRSAPSFSPVRGPDALLHVYERVDAFMTPDFELLLGLDLPALTLRRSTLRHIHFTTLGFLAVADSTVARLTRAGRETPDALAHVADATVRFLGDTK